MSSVKVGGDWRCFMKIKIPGKLFVMGEYSVTQTNRHAVVCAVDKFLYASIESSDAYQMISSQGRFKWILDEGLPVLRYDHLKHVKAALYISHQYLKYLKVKPLVYKIVVKSELDNDNETKYGLGSSGAVIVAVIKAVTLFHGIKVSNLQLFKLSVLAQIDAVDVTSGAELAASIYTGWVYYKKYDYLWVLNHRGLSMKIVDMKWPGLEIEKIPGLSYELAVCYTGYSQSTKDYMDKIATKDLKSVYYQTFLKDAEHLVQTFKDALIHHNDDMLFKSIDTYRAKMHELALWGEISIESAPLTKMIESANSLGYHAKVSGAGNGDCGIALVKKDMNITQLNKLWQTEGLIPLDIHVWEEKNV